jgi:hypothetical protein
MFRAHKWKASHVGIDHAMARSSISMAFPWRAYEIRISMATNASSNCLVNQAAAKAADQFQTVGFGSMLPHLSGFCLNLARARI